MYGSFIFFKDMYVLNDQKEAQESFTFKFCTLPKAKLNFIKNDSFVQDYE